MEKTIGEASNVKSRPASVHCDTAGFSPCSDLLKWSPTPLGWMKLKDYSIERLEFHYTPKHGSWLNIAENELSSMTRQCVKDRRFGAIEELRLETKAWATHVNERQRGVDWQFRIDDAQKKLRSVYPKIVM